PSGATYFFSRFGDALGRVGRTEGFHGSFDSHENSVIYDNGITFFFSGTDCLRRLYVIKDRNGNFITIERDSSGAPIKIVDSMKRTVIITPVGGLILSISPPGGLASISYTYLG